MTQRQNIRWLVSGFWTVLVIGVLLSSFPAVAQTKVTGGLSPAQVLVIKDQIREAWAQYTLMHQGDGLTDEGDKWADRSFTPDAIFQVYSNDGRKLREYRGLEEIRKYNSASIASQGPWKQTPGKHLPIITAYDEVTPTTAKTRTVLVDITVERSTVKGVPDTAPGMKAPGVPSSVGLAVYHDTWKKQGDVWKKSESILYAANSGCFPSDFALKGCPTNMHKTNPPPTR